MTNVFGGVDRQRKIDKNRSLLTRLYMVTDANKLIKIERRKKRHIISRHPIMIKDNNGN